LKQGAGSALCCASKAETALEIHGEWRLKTVRDILVTTLSGSWNDEASVAYFVEFRAAA